MSYRNQFSLTIKFKACHEMRIPKIQEPNPYPIRFFPWEHNHPVYIASHFAVSSNGIPHRGMLTFECLGAFPSRTMLKIVSL